MAAKNPAAPRHARLTNDALALLFLWSVVTVLLVFGGIAFAAASRASGSHAAIVRTATGLPVFTGLGAVIQGMRFEWNSSVVTRRRRRGKNRSVPAERTAHWPVRPGDLDLLIQLGAGLLAALGTQPS